MLVDLPVEVSGFTNNPRMEQLARLTGGSPKPERLEKGVYIAHLNFDHELQAAGIMKAKYPFNDWHSGQPYDPNSPNEYGVCDNYHQIIARWWRQLDVPDRKFVIYLTEMRKELEPPEGGWRWHKWGEYIGTETPQCEYLYDEPEIEAVFCFHIVELN